MITRLKRLLGGVAARLSMPRSGVAVIAAGVGFVCALHGLYGLVGRDWTLLVGGVVVVVAALVVDVD